MSTRGLFVLHVRAPAAPDRESFRWMQPPPDLLPQDVKVFIDGSLFTGALLWARRTGFGIAIVSNSGSLLALGNGIPPPWIIDAAGAELWAFYVVASMFPALPRIVTDCKGILDGLESSPLHMCGRSKALARTWKMVDHVLDGDFASARRMVTWMPAHTSLASIGQARDSEGCTVDSIMWRANRLVDVLAKAAAAKHRLPASSIQHIQLASRLYTHQAARLGKATYDANNYRVVETLDGGIEASRIVRDSAAVRRPPSRRARQASAVEHDDGMSVGQQRQQQPEQFALRNRLTQSAAKYDTQSMVEPEPVEWPTAGRPRRTGARCRCVSTPPTAQAIRSRKSATQAATHQLKMDADEEVAVSRWVAALHLRPQAGATAEERFSALQDRIREKARRAASAGSAGF